MKFNRYLKRTDIKLLVKPDTIEKSRSTVDRRIIILTDPRTYTENGYYHVHPIAVTKTGKSVHIVCPYCGNIHVHGNAPGHRIGHCDLSRSHGYYLEGDGFNAGD